MLKFLPIALLATLAMTCSSLPPEVPIPEDNKNSVSKTEDGHNVVVYPEKHLDNILTKIDTATTAEGFSKTLFFKDMKPEDIPSIGDIIASPATENAPYGFLCKVLGVSTKDGVTAVAVRDAALEEAVEEADFESETNFEFDEDGNLLRTLQKSTLPSVGLVTEISFENDRKLTVDVSYTIKFIFNIEIKRWKLQSTKMSIKQDGKTALKGSIKEKVEKTIVQDLGKKDKLPNITFWIGWVPVVITNDLSYYLKIAGNAETYLEATYTLNTSGEYGFEYQNGSFKKIATSSLEHSFDLEQSVSGEISIGAIARLETKLYGIAGLAIDAGPSLKLSVEGKPIGTYVFEDGFQNSEKNGAYLDYGLDIAEAITLGMLGFNLRYTFREDWITLKRICGTSFLPSFDSLQVNTDTINSKITIISGIKRDILNYPVKTFGICIENTIGACKKGNGERKILGENVRLGEYRRIDTTFNNIEYKDYYIIPYFENGIGGTYYDKYIPIVDGVAQSSNSNSVSCKIEDYKTVVIGTQTWMAENLNCGSGLCYDNSNANCSKYGRLYNWATAMALDSSCNKVSCSDQVQPKHKGICPDGWHIPSDDEWTVLMDYAGGSSEAGKYLKTANGWSNNGNGLDSYEFAALPGGLGYSAELFQTEGNGGYWWSSSENNAGYAFYRGIYYDNENVGRYYDKKSNLFSVRCIED